MAACGVERFDKERVATASVLSVERRDEGCTLLLRPPKGEIFSVEVAQSPDEEGAKALELTSGRAMALKLTKSGGTLACSALVTSRSGPSRADVSVPVALALCERGVHTVMVTEATTSDS